MIQKNFFCNWPLTPYQDDSALNFYGTPRGKGGHQKRQLTPDNSATNKRHAIAAVAGSSPVTFSPTRSDFFKSGHLPDEMRNKFHHKFHSYLLQTFD